MIFGVEAPKIIVNIDTTLDEVLLNYAVVLKDEPELDTYSKTSIRTGKTVSNNAGKHWLFQVKIHLWKYADPSAKYLELKSYEGTEVILYRHSDGEPIYDTYGNAGIFVLTSLIEQYSDRTNLYDVVILTFESTDYIKRSVPPLPESSLYYMNLYTDSPVGSLSMGNSGNDKNTLYEINHLVSTEKCMQSDLDGIYYLNVNGYKAQLYNSGNPNNYNIYFNSVNKDVLNGFEDLTLILAFKRIDYVIDPRYILSHYGTDYAPWLSLFFAGGSDVGKIKASMQTSRTVSDACTIMTSDRYDNNEWHIVVVIFNQTTKTISLYTETGEALTNNNPAYSSSLLTTNIDGSPTFGYWNDPDSIPRYFMGSSGAEPSIGDILFYNGVLSRAQINAKANWIANRLGITWNNIP